MATGYIEKFLPTFRVILRTKNAFLPNVIEKLDRNIIKFFIECAYNILKGIIPLDGFLLIRAKQFKSLYQQFTKKTVPIKKKNRLWWRILHLSKVLFA